MPTVRDIRAKTGEEPITMATAYDAPAAEILEEADIDIALVGDSLGNTTLGYETTLPVTVDDMARHVGAVTRATAETVVVADMPFLSVGVSEEASVRNAGRMLKEEGAKAVKLECGAHTVGPTERMVQLGIPVMGHLGLTPQHVNEYGGHPRQGTDSEAAEEILELAQAHEEAGAFSLVLEHVPSNVARTVTEAIDIPTIGIGAGGDCDGQVLVFDDIVGLSERPPPFAKRYGNVREEMEQAIVAYAEDIRSGDFPGEKHSHEATDLDGFEPPD